MLEGLREGMLSQSDVELWYAIAVVVALLVISLMASHQAPARGKKLRP